MKIDIKDVLTLDDGNKYVVVSKVSYENKVYYYLVDMNNNGNVKFCYCDSDELVELNNNALIMKLLPLFLKASKDEIKNLKAEIN